MAGTPKNLLQGFMHVHGQYRMVMPLWPSWAHCEDHRVGSKEVEHPHRPIQPAQGLTRKGHPAVLAYEPGGRWTWQTGTRPSTTDKQKRCFRLPTAQLCKAMASKTP